MPRGKAPTYGRTVAVYPGTFDPVTNGHMDIITRGLKLFDRIIIAVAPNPVKNPMFSHAERVKYLKIAVKDLSGVSVEPFSGLLVDFVNKRKAGAIIKGLRAISDFEHEMQMSLINRRLSPSTETVFFMTGEEYSFISSSMIKEIFTMTGDVSRFVPKKVAGLMSEKFHRPKNK